MMAAGGIPLFEPRNAEEAAAFLREAAGKKDSLLPCGRRSRVARHLPGLQPGGWLSLAGLGRLIRFDPEDQTCEVEAGMPPAGLARETRERGLELAVEAPCGNEGTLGGLFLAPDLSLLQAAWGPPRDQVLGGEWLLADGTRVRTGARVVKSVAGYDVTRLFLGSRGRLAVCLRLFLRLRPLPRRERWFRVAPEQVAGWLPADPRARPPARMLFCAQAGTDTWAQTDGFTPPQALFRAKAEPGEGRAAKNRLLQGFAAAAVRWILPFPAVHRMARNGFDQPLDWLSGTLFAPKRTWEPFLHGSPARVVPPPRPSPWLEPIQAACAPGVTPLGRPRS